MRINNNMSAVITNKQLLRTEKQSYKIHGETFFRFEDQSCKG